ncbi:MAG: hypothetical protein HY539_06185, partial [Deltaproteobacteria bacterium]|nr:hypothetical protein [Deltaproteobacteria bacterium]
MTTFSEKGLSALAAVAVMVLLSVLGLAVASVVSNSKEIYRDQYFYDRTSYV